MIAVAQRTVPDNVYRVLGDIAHLPLPAGGHDAITGISALHHVELPEALPRPADALRPGGRHEVVRHKPAASVAPAGCVPYFLSSPGRDVAGPAPGPS